MRKRRRAMHRVQARLRRRWLMSTLVLYYDGKPIGELQPVIVDESIKPWDHLVDIDGLETPPDNGVITLPCSFAGKANRH